MSSSSSSSRVRAPIEFEVEPSSSFAFSSSIRSSFFKLTSFRARVEFKLEFSSSSRAQLNSSSTSIISTPNREYTKRPIGLRKEGREGKKTQTNPTKKGRS